MVLGPVLVMVASSCVASCRAFIPPPSSVASPASASSSALRMSAGTDYVSTLPGAPFPGGEVWDPVGLADGADPTDIKKWREAEIKHGRVAMLASVGVLVAEVSLRQRSYRSTTALLMCVAVAFVF